MKRRSNRRLALFLLIAAGCTSGYLALSRKNKERAQQQTEGDVQTNDIAPEITMNNFVLRQIVDPTKSGWIISAKKSDIFHGAKTVELDEVECKMMQAHKEIAVLHAQKTFIDQESKNVQLFGPVHGDFNDLTVEGHNFNYCFSQNVITSKEQAIYKNPDFTITAEKSRIDLGQKKAFLSGGVKTEFGLK